MIRTAAPGLVAALVVLTVLQGLIPAALALALRGLINAAAGGGAGVDVGSQLVGWVALAFVLTAADALTGLAVAFAGQRLTDDLNFHLTGEILAHAWSLDLSFFEDPERQDLLSRTQANVGVQLQALVLEALNVVRQLLTGVALLLLLAHIEPLVLLVVPPFAIPFLYFQWRLAKQRHVELQRRATNLRWTSYFVSKLTAPESVAEVKLLDLGPLLIERFRRIHAEFRDRDRVLHLRNFRGTSLAALLTIGALCALFARVAARTAAGVVSLGDLAIFGGAAIRLRLALNDIIRSGVACLERLMSLGNLREFLEVRPAVATGKGLTPPLDRGAVEIRDVTFTYPGGSAPVLRGLSLSIQPGETLALVGESGAGKSTLVKLLARLYDPDEGQILFDGVDLRDIEPAHLHQRIGLVLQSFGRYEASAAENIAYGDWRRLLGRREEIERLAREANLHETIANLPKGYDTHLGQSFGTLTLSGGEWQRVAMARAFARQASLLILDEPTAHLDARAEYELFTRFNEQSHGRTTLLISHRFTTISLADRIAVLADGRVVELGGHHELLDRRGAYASLYRLYERLSPGAASEVVGATAPR
ncbi:MAG TPA: ABC transporter ATP-binding protein [Gemmatimonadales bacterium]|nr:ABC transporter ATP-binding protein [Gemmatimonadales bacterium]